MAAAGIKHFTDEQVLSSQPSLVNAMQLVRANALESGAVADRMFLKVSQGSLAGLDLLWDQPSLSWVVKAGCVVAPDPEWRGDSLRVRKGGASC